MKKTAHTCIKIKKKKNETNYKVIKYTYNIHTWYIYKYPHYTTHTNRLFFFIFQHWFNWTLVLALVLSFRIIVLRKRCVFFDLNYLRIMNTMLKWNQVNRQTKNQQLLRRTQSNSNIVIIPQKTKNKHTHTIMKRIHKLYINIYSFCSTEERILRENYKRDELQKL